MLENYRIPIDVSMFVIQIRGALAGSCVGVDSPVRRQSSGPHFHPGAAMSYAVHLPFAITGINY